MTQTAETFWEKVDKTGSCWEWQGYCINKGYGRVSWKGDLVLAHRLAAFLSRMIDDPRVPTDRKKAGFVLHNCNNRKCCNPAHLFVGTYSDNLNRAYSKGRRPKPRRQVKQKVFGIVEFPDADFHLKWLQKKLVGPWEGRRRDA